MATVDPTAIYPSERERTVKGVGADGVEAHIHHGAYRSDYEAKRAAVQWDGPAPAPE